MAKKCYIASLKSASLTCGLVSLIFSMSMVTASVTSLFYNNSISGCVLTAFLINGIVDLVSSVCCIHAVCTESCNYLLPWIFTASIGIIFMFVVSLSYMMYGIDDYIYFGAVLFIIAILFAIGWVCVLSYYYQLCDKKNARMVQRLQRRARRNLMNASEISVTSVSSVIIDDYRTPPPAYNMVFKNPVFEGDDKLPTYEETVRENNHSRSDDGVANRRF